MPTVLLSGMSRSASVLTEPSRSRVSPIGLMHEAFPHLLSLRAHLGRHFLPVYQIRLCTEYSQMRTATRRRLDAGDPGSILYPRTGSEPPSYVNTVLAAASQTCKSSPPPGVVNILHSCAPAHTTDTEHWKQTPRHSALSHGEKKRDIASACQYLQWCAWRHLHLICWLILFFSYCNSWHISSIL